MILVEKSAVQLLFCCKKKKNYNAVVSRQNIRIRLLLFLLFDVNFFFCLFWVQICINCTCLREN